MWWLTNLVANYLVGFKIDLREKNLMLGGLLDELILMYMSLWLIMRT